MEQIEKILVEIQRLKKELDGYTASEALDYIESYINLIRREYSLPSTLDEAARKAALVSELVGVNEEHLDEYPYSPIAEQKFKEGAKWQKEQMMSEAVEGFIYQSEDYYPKELIARYDGGLKHGDKVRVIVLPKED